MLLFEVANNDEEIGDKEEDGGGEHEEEDDLGRKARGGCAAVSGLFVNNVEEDPVAAPPFTVVSGAILKFK